MLQLTGTKSEKCDLFIVLVVILGFCLYFWGTVANMVVTSVNDDAMPVVLGETTILVSENGVVSHANKQGKLLFLSDSIFVKFTNIEDKIPTGIIGDAFRWWAKHLDYPLSDDEYMVGIVSIGDLMRWVGSLLFLILNPIVILLIPFRLYLMYK